MGNSLLIVLSKFDNPKKREPGKSPGKMQLTEFRHCQFSRIIKEKGAENYFFAPEFLFRFHGDPSNSGVNYQCGSCRCIYKG